MAKTKKSRVSRILPDIEETTKAVEQLTKDVYKLQDKTSKAVNDFDDNKYPAIEKRSKGRPKATHGKIRFTTLLEKDLRDKMNLIKVLTGEEVNKMFSDAVRAYVAEWEKEHSGYDLEKMLGVRK